MRALPLLAVTAIVSGCLVDNPAYDPTPATTVVKDAGLDAPKTSDLAPFIDAPVIDAAAIPDVGGGIDMASLDATPDVGGDSSVNALPPFCNSKDPALSLCLTFEGDVADHSANAIALSGQANLVPGLDGSAYQVVGNVGLISNANAAFVSKQLNVDLWVSLNSLPETLEQALVVVPGVISMSATNQGEVVCQMGVLRVTSLPKILKLNTWTGIACNYEGTGLNIYANGQSVGGRSDNTIVPSVTTSPINIGSAAGFAAFTGDIDNLRFWRKRLTPNELCKSSPECVQ